MVRPEVSFHTAGRRQPHGDSYIVVDQSYVQYLPAADSTASSAPVLFLHGGGLTGHMWEATPDRRPGWAPLAARPPYNHPVYIQDTIDTGRSLRAPDSLRPTAIEYRSAAEYWQMFRFGPPDRFEAREPFPNGQFPLECYDMMLGSQAARRFGADQFELEIRGIRDVLEEIGEPTHVIAHSKAGALVSVLAQRAQHLFKSLALIEPGPHVGRHSWDNAIPVLIVWGDNFETSVGSSKELDADPWKKGLHDTASQALYADIKRATVYHLPDMGIKGNTHFPMMDRNSDHIGRLILDWVHNVPPT